LENGLIENAARQGEYMLGALREMQARHPNMGDVRGKGLMIAVEWVKDKSSRERAPELRAQITRECYLRGLLVLGCGQNSTRFSPALTVTRSQIDAALERFESALMACEAREL
jgi:4-aminobutyrate aminotransferase